MWISRYAALDTEYTISTAISPCKLLAMGKAVERPKTLDRLLSMLEKAGTWGLAAVSLIPGGGFYLWASFLQMPRPVAAVIGIYAVAGGLWLCTGLRELRRQRRRNEERPDYEKWNLVTTFTFAQAANLWADRRPDLSFDDSANAIFSMLKEQAGSGGLDATPLGPDFHGDSLALRGDLMTLARRMKQRPKFLFNKGAR